MECNCCKESDSARMQSLLEEAEVNCIVEHPGFESVCLNPWVLETAFNAFKQYHRSEAMSDKSHR